MADTANDVDIRHIARLARLELTDAELSAFQTDIEKIVTHVRQLQQIDVEAVEPTAHATAISNVFRRDEAAPSLSRDVMLANAPAVLGEDLIKVPVVLAGDEPGDA